MNNINDKENAIINEMIDRLLGNTLNAKNTHKSEKEKISDIVLLGSFLKKEIKEEKKLNPNNFYSTKKFYKENKEILPLFLISNLL